MKRWLRTNHEKVLEYPNKKSQLIYCCFPARQQVFEVVAGDSFPLGSRLEKRLREAGC